MTSAIEHSSTLAAAGTRTAVGVGAGGRPGASGPGRSGPRDSRSGEVAAACLQVANHEVGTRQPYEAAAQLCRRADVPLVLDATSRTRPGRPELAGAGWSVLTGVAGAFGGPVSVGVLVHPAGCALARALSRRRLPGRSLAGPPDVPAIVAAAVALETWLADRERSAIRQHALVDRLRVGIAERVNDVDVVGDPVARVPHLLTCSVLYVDGETLTLELDRAGFAVASGSACSASSETPSHVLAAMGALTHGNLRIGLTRTTTQAEVDALLTALPPVVDRIRATLGAP